MAALALAVAWPASAAALQLEPCRLAAHEGRVEAEASCGLLPVPLDAAAPDGETIELFVAVARALAEEPAPDPLVVIAGGPGDAATRFFAQSQAAFARILRRRDILLVDQRGTGQSAPLHCEELESSAAVELGSDVDALVRMTLNCASALPRDPRFFTTGQAVQDLERVRVALGYRRLNLYGISYGTRVAQHYARRFPDNVRSVMLDGVVPPALALGPEVALNSQAALEALFERCRADSACGESYPHLAARFDEALARLRAKPAQVTFDHPRTGEATTAPVDHMTMGAVVRLLLYSPVSASLLPALVEAAHGGDYRALAAQAHFVAEALKGLASGLNYAVMCAEDEPFWGEVDMAAQAATYLGTGFMEIGRRVCAGWPRGAADADLREPLAGDVPVLLLSGELDPITPPRYAEEARQGLTNSRSLVGKGQGHGMLLAPCAQRLMADFVDGADPGALDVSCMERVRPFPPFASPMGPGP